MSVAIDTNVLVRLLVRDDEARFALALRLVEEALHLWSMHPGSDFADCLLSARAAHLGRSRFVTFDVRATRLRLIGVNPGLQLASS